MSHPNSQGNGCSLEDCHTNLFALVSRDPFELSCISVTIVCCKAISKFIKMTTGAIVYYTALNCLWDLHLMIIIQFTLFGNYSNWLTSNNCGVTWLKLGSTYFQTPTSVHASGHVFRRWPFSLLILSLMFSRYHSLSD